MDKRNNSSLFSLEVYITMYFRFVIEKGKKGKIKVNTFNNKLKLLKLVK